MTTSNRYLPDSDHRFLERATAAHDLNALIQRQSLGQCITEYRLILHNEDTQFRVCCSHPCPPVTVRSLTQWAQRDPAV